MIFIEEQREKTKFEGSLPPTSDEICFILRRKLMEGQEVRDWQRKEKNIKKLQKNKLNLLQNLLEERENLAELENKKRIDILKQKNTEQKNLLKVVLDKRKVKVLRKVQKIRNAFLNLNKKKDLIDEYKDYSSKIYAKLTREGLCPNFLNESFNFNFEQFQNLESFNKFIDILSETDLEFDLEKHSNLVLHTQQKLTKLERYHRYL